MAKVNFPNMSSAGQSSSAISAMQHGSNTYNNHLKPRLRADDGPTTVRPYSHMNMDGDDALYFLGPNDPTNQNIEK